MSPLGNPVKALVVPLLLFAGFILLQCVAGPKITHAVCSSVDTGAFRVLTTLFYGNFEETEDF